VVKQKVKKRKSFWWGVYAGEELPVAISYAKTKTGAIKFYQEATHDYSEEIHAEKLEFIGHCAPFTTAKTL